MTERIVRTAVAAILLVVLLAGCQSVVEGGGRRCNIKPNTPHESSGSPGWIVGKAQIKCTAAATVTHYVKLEKRMSSGSWTIVDANDGTITASQSTSQQVRQATVPCASGRYRLKGKINMTVSGTTYYGSWSYSPERLNPCGTGVGGGGGGGGTGSW